MEDEFISKNIIEEEREGEKKVMRDKINQFMASELIDASAAITILIVKKEKAPAMIASFGCITDSIALIKILENRIIPDLKLQVINNIFNKK
jgi:hypothetical protein